MSSNTPNRPTPPSLPPRSTGQHSFDRTDGENSDAEDFEGDPTNISELANAAPPQPLPLTVAPIPPPITGPGPGYAPFGYPPPQDYRPPAPVPASIAPSPYQHTGATPPDTAPVRNSQRMMAPHAPQGHAPQPSPPPSNSMPIMEPNPMGLSSNIGPPVSGPTPYVNRTRVYAFVVDEYSVKGFFEPVRKVTPHHPPRTQRGR